MGFLTGDDAPVIWRGPMLHGVIQQFFREVRWDELDYLIVDMPPGTGDVALSLSQTVPVAGAIVVTTPQPVSLADTRRAVRDVSEAEHPDARPHREHEPLRVPGLPARRATSSARAAARRWPRELVVPFLGRIPIYEPIRDGGDTGVPIMISEPESPAARAFRSAAEQLAAQVSIASYKRADSAHAGLLTAASQRFERIHAASGSGVHGAQRAQGVRQVPAC